jgi:hypothetical protein
MKVIKKIVVKKEDAKWFYGYYNIKSVDLSTGEKLLFEGMDTYRVDNNKNIRIIEANYDVYGHNTYLILDHYDPNTESFIYALVDLEDYSIQEILETYDGGSTLSKTEVFSYLQEYLSIIISKYENFKTKTSLKDINNDFKLIMGGQIKLYQNLNFKNQSKNILFPIALSIGSNLNNNIKEELMLFSKICFYMALDHAEDLKIHSIDGETTSIIGVAA